MIFDYDKSWTTWLSNPVRKIQRMSAKNDFLSFYGEDPSSENAQEYACRTSDLIVSAPRHEIGFGLIGAQWFAPLLRKKRYEHVMDWCCGTGVFGLGVGHLLRVEQTTFADLSQERLDILEKRHVPLNGSSTSTKNYRIVQGDGLEAVKGKFDLIVGSPPFFSGPDDSAMDAIGYKGTKDHTFFVQSDGSLYRELLNRLNDLSSGTTEVCFFGVGMHEKLPGLIESVKAHGKISNLLLEQAYGTVYSVYFVYTRND